MRYFNIEQHKSPKGMYDGDRKVDISELEKTAKEITTEEAKVIPSWGSGNISVDEKGNWNNESNNWDTSG